MLITGKITLLVNHTETNQNLSKLTWVN